MSITTESNRTAELTTDGVETEFDFSMVIHADSEVQVWYKATGGDYSQLTLDTHYTVVFTEDGGTVTTIGGSSPYAAGVLLIIRHLPLTQLTNWLYNDNHTEQTHQDDFDRSTMRDLQIQEQLDRAVGFAIHSSTKDIEFPEPSAGEYIAWNDAGTALQNRAALTSLDYTDGNFIVGDGTNWIVESGATARASLGLVIGTNVLAYDAGLQNLAGVAMAADKFYYTSGDNTHVAATVTAFARTILDDANEATFKATVNLEIGTDVLAEQTIGIADNNLLEVDGTPNSGEYAKFTANGLEGKTFAEMATDLDYVKYDTFAGNLYTLTNDSITLTNGTLTADTLTDGTATITGGLGNFGEGIIIPFDNKYIILGSGELSKIWCDASNDFNLHNLFHGANLYLGAENDSGTLRQVFLDPDAPAWAPETSAIDLGSPGRYWGDLRLVGEATIGGSGGAKLSASVGVLTLAGIGNTNNNNLLFDFEASATDVNVSSTEVTGLDWGSLNHTTSGTLGAGLATLATGSVFGIGKGATTWGLLSGEVGETAEESASALTTAQKQSTISVQGAGQAYFIGRDVTNDIEFVMGTSALGAAFAGSVTAHDFWLRTDNANRVTIKSSTGYVGIGVTAPGSLLHVQGVAETNVHTETLADLIVEDTETTFQLIADDAGNNAGIIVMTNAPAAGDNKHWIIAHRGATVSNRFSIGYGTSAADNFAAWSTSNEAFIIDTSGNVGIGIVPRVALDVTGEAIVNDKIKMTSIGGYAIKLTNTTGVVTVAGQTVKADPATDDAVILTAADDTECIGVFLDSGIADDAEAWVVVAGIADVAMENDTTATRGNWVQTSETEAGYADATDTSPQAAPQHFNEIGHCLETVTATGGGTHILARCVIHFL